MRIPMRQLKSIIFFIPLIIFVFFALKGCIKTGFKTNFYEAYEGTDQSGQDEKLFLLPNNKMIIIKSVLEAEVMEAGLYKINGIKGTNYFGDLWNISESGSPLGLRWITNAQSVWLIHLEFKSTFGVGISETSFPDVGTEYKTALIYYNNEIKIGAQRYSKIPVNEKAIMAFLDTLEKTEKTK